MDSVGTISGYCCNPYNFMKMCSNFKSAMFPQAYNIGNLCITIPSSSSNKFALAGIDKLVETTIIPAVFVYLSTLAYVLYM